MRFLLSAMLVLICLGAGAQNNQSKKTSEYTKKPLWITMMENPNANFFEIEKAFELYWSIREKPEGEHEEIGEHAERQKTPGKRKLRKISAENDMRFAVKKYVKWHEQTLPYVQPDGRILSTEERLKIWQSQKQQ